MFIDFGLLYCEVESIAAGDRYKHGENRDHLRTLRTSILPQQIFFNVCNTALDGMILPAWGSSRCLPEPGHHLFSHWTRPNSYFLEDKSLAKFVWYPTAHCDDFFISTAVYLSPHYTYTAKTGIFFSRWINFWVSSTVFCVLPFRLHQHFPVFFLISIQPGRFIFGLCLSNGFSYPQEWCDQGHWLKFWVHWMMCAYRRDVDPSRT